LSEVNQISPLDLSVTALCTSTKSPYVRPG